jgi:hypothetical protein
MFMLTRILVCHESSRHSKERGKGVAMTQVVAVLCHKSPMHKGIDKSSLLFFP